METPLVTSLSNPLIKQARALRQKKARMESGAFLVEGIHHVGEAVAAGWEVDSVFYAPDLLTSSFARDLIRRLEAASSTSPHSVRSVSAQRKPQPVSAQVMESMADKDNPQGILAIVRQKHLRLDDLKPIRSAAALVSPQDPGNVGTILRTLDAVGADMLFLLEGGVELYHPGVVRSSMGAIFWKPIVQLAFDEFTEWARQKNCHLIGTSAHGDVDYQTVIPRTPWVLVMGSEQKGLSAAQANACDVTVSLPMNGRVSSLNLAVAAGVLLYHFCR
ncbi:MAG TPA: RNA methyltransferase [Anaerolineales bacterium]|nr:RNA methyltransferase [Anaerolineales bacterium]